MHCRCGFRFLCTYICQEKTYGMNIPCQLCWTTHINWINLNQSGLYQNDFVFPNFSSTRNQVDEEPLSGCATSKSLFILFMLIIYVWKQSVSEALLDTIFKVLCVRQGYTFFKFRIILFYIIQWCRCMYHHRLLNDVWFVMITNFSRPRGVHAVTATITTWLNWSKANNLWPPNNPTMGNIFTKLHDATQDSARER